MSDKTPQFEDLLLAESTRMSVEFMVYGALIGFIVGGTAVPIFQDMLQAVMA